MRIFLGFTMLLAGFVAAAPASATCYGKDMILELPEAELAAIVERSDSYPYANGNFWQATRGDQKITLAGTYHLPDDRHEELLPALTPYLQDARKLFVEATSVEEEMLKAEIARRPEFVVITEGPRLSEQLSEEEWEKLSKEAQQRGIPPFMADRFRPWYMAVMLGMPACAMEEIQEGGRGLDHLIVGIAESQNIPVVALEPFDTLFSIFGELSAEDETEMVRATLMTAERPEDLAVTLANSYFAGKSRLIWEFSRDLAAELPGSTPEELDRQYALMEDVLMVRRNKRWLPILLEGAKDSPVFAAFGALHLSGEDGVLKLLEKEGFTIRQLQI